MSCGRRCQQCARGVVPGDAKLFKPDCPGCQDKLKRGLRTGLEPHFASRAYSTPQGFARLRQGLDAQKRARMDAIRTRPAIVGTVLK